jgi:hypothetical protein
MFALGIVPAAPGLKFVHQHKAKPTRYWPASVVQAISEVNGIFGHAEFRHSELVDLFSAVLLSVLFCIIALAIVQKITEPTLLCTPNGYAQHETFIPEPGKFRPFDRMRLSNYT